jgi:hypothetical protein
MILTANPQILINRLDNYRRYAQSYLWISNKQGITRPFFLNPIQNRYLRIKEAARKRGFKKFIVLKYRQGGITTEEQAESFHLVATKENQRAMTLAQDTGSTENIFRISQMFYDNLSAEVKPKRLADSNKRDLNFPSLNSLFSIGTAGNKTSGRSQTLQKVHGSEIAFWPGTYQDIQRLVAGLTIACSNGEVVFESTANGIGNWFHKIWVDAKAGRNNWFPIFLAWYMDPLNMVPLADGEVLDLTEEETALVDTYNLIAEQIKWRRMMQADVGELFPQEFPEDDISAFMVTGLHWFNISIVNNLVKYCKEPVETRDDGSITIWVKPQSSHRYVAGGDVAEGLPNGDFSNCNILDSVSGEQAAKLRGRWAPDLYAKKAVELCVEYNKALLGIERNNHGHSALNTARNTLHYNRLYMHRDYDAESDTQKSRLGYPTDQKTRPILLDDLKAATESRSMIVNDQEYLGECIVFEDTGSGKYEARSGFHDDDIMGWGIAWQIRKKGHLGEPDVVV